MFEVTRLLLHLPHIKLEPTENDSYYTFTTMIKHAQTTREPVVMLEQLLEYCGLPSEDKMSEEDVDGSNSNESPGHALFTSRD